MPRRTDIRSILVIGSGPIVIGQAAEFDYSGTQALKALRREGYRVILVNSNPATIMTDPEFADATYIEPLVPEIVEQIIARERPDALLPTLGGQTALNLAMALYESGVLERYRVELIGASPQAIRIAEDRLAFKEAMERAGLEVPHSVLARSIEEALAFAERVGYPVLIRPSFTLGGTGAGIARSREELIDRVDFALRLSPVGSALIEESLLGWKEFELEVMRDRHDNFVVVCSIENLDPMGIHTGDSITVAPAQTLTDKEYQRMRDWARAVMSAVGVETGGSNVQFAVNPHDGRMRVIEMNPRVSRSSALASKATGFPIAKVAALLAVGYTLDELRNEITRRTVAAFEPALDYVVVKIPRWAFEKFPGADPTLGPQMKSVGEVMAIGRTFPEALQKALRGLEIGAKGFEGFPPDRRPADLQEALTCPNPDRLRAVHDALVEGMPVEEIAALTGYDPWFVAQMAELVELERTLRRYTLHTVPATLLHRAKRAGFSDAQLAAFWGCTELEVRRRREAAGIRPRYAQVDTCAAEFEAYTPYLYSTYEESDEAPPTDRSKVIILGSGPNRIGQGIEFDYSCCQAAFALRELGIESIMVNSNPETVSTDYDTSDRLYFEPLTFEDVLNIVERERPLGVIVQFGGQTALNLTLPLHRAGVRILGTSPDAIDLAEDRGRFSALLRDLDIPQPEHGTATSIQEALAVAERIGYPVLVRPSYVLGGRAMAICYDAETLTAYMREAVWVSPERPVLIDRFLEDAYEVEVDAVADGKRVVIGGILQHIEEAGVHSGDSACVLPPYKISRYHLQIIEEYTERLALALEVRGLINIQFAIKDDIVYVLEANPRASRTVPFISKATGVPLARIATRVMLGQTLEEIGFTRSPEVRAFFVKEAVLPFRKLPGADAILGPEMKSTGEVMGWAERFGHAFAKAEMAAGDTLPLSGTVLLSVNDFDKGSVIKIARDFHRLGFRLMATRGTAEVLRRVGLPVEAVNKVSEGSPHVVDAIREGRVQLILNTPLGPRAYTDGMRIRQAAIRYGVPLLTTLSAAAAAVQAIRAMRESALTVRSLQEYYEEAKLVVPSSQSKAFSGKG
ncbi:carbamoyl-phosphate synthase large subunit [Thermoflexus sp.]|uniref:carbamoyl-phosphate synthase large subunit n=1 Tax=Thermoflexus sp. TaxID=1969742 RepID=UPI0035E44CDA